VQKPHPAALFFPRETRNKGTMPAEANYTEDFAELHRRPEATTASMFL